MIMFVIPAYNEAENIDALLDNIGRKMKELNRGDYRILLINDGSMDSTEEKALSARDRIPLEVISHETNRGVGQAFRTGFSRALEIAGDNDIIVTKEADNTSDLDILDAMLDKIDSHTDVVLASCYAPEGKIVGTTIDRIFLSSVANGMLKLLFPIKGINTYSSFYRAYRTASLRKAFGAYGSSLIEENGFVCMVEMLIKFSKLGLRIDEVPMILRCDFRKGKSKMNKWKTVGTYVRLIARECKSARSKA
ncbi:MAG: glycosyltransferase family 2 protein [Candidatus Omnitrophota bacterium]